MFLKVLRPFEIPSYFKLSDETNRVAIIIMDVVGVKCKERRSRTRIANNGLPLELSWYVVS